MQSLPVLDVTAITRKRLEKRRSLFDEKCHEQLLPLHQIDGDPVRKELDTRFGEKYSAYLSQ